MISHKQRKSRFCGRSLYTCLSLSHLSFWVDKFGVHWKITHRTLRDGWDRWAFIERSLRDRGEIVERSLRDHFPSEIVLDWVKTLRRPWWQRRSLRDHWEILTISGRSLGALWKIVERSGHCFIAQRSLNDRHPCVKWFLLSHHFAYIFKSLCTGMCFLIDSYIP